MNFEQVPLQDDPTDGEWYAIGIFKERIVEVIGHVLRLRLTGDLTFSFLRRPDGTYRGSGEVPSDEELRLLYFEFRHLYAEREPGRFFKLLKIVSGRSRDERVKRCMKHLKAQSRNEVVESGFFHDQGGKLSGKQLVDTWFNARLFHSDRERREELAKLNNWLGEEGVRILLFHTVRDAILAAKNLYHLIKDLERNRRIILLPEEFCGNVHESA